MPYAAFRLRWQRTWGNKENDFEARDTSGYCRIYRLDAGPQGGRWRWSAARETSLGEGNVDTAREAALEAERVFLGS